MIMNEALYPWLKDTSGADGDSLFASAEAQSAILLARDKMKNEGAVKFSNFLTEAALENAANDLHQKEDNAFTTNVVHTAYLKDADLHAYPKNSVFNHQMRTIVASTAYDQLSPDSVLRKLYHDPRLLKLVSCIVERPLYLSEDPLGCCSVNVFRPDYHHSFHFDESEGTNSIL